MKRFAFLLAFGALVATAIDFVRTTRPALRRARELHTELAETYRAGIERAGRLGASPPTAREVADAEACAAGRQAEARVLHAAWYAAAKRPSDYLVERSARPQRDDAAGVLGRLEERLLALRAELKPWSGTLAARFQLRTPSLSRPLALEGDELDDQVERAVAASFLAATLPEPPGMQVLDAQVRRDASGALVVALALDGPAGTLAALARRMAAPSDRAPPRSIDSFALLRIDPREWRRAGDERTEPPVRLELALRFHFPRDATEAGR